jgi:hypothetical protein
MTIVDSWKAYSHHLSKRHRHKQIGIIEFASLLARDLLHNKMTRTADVPGEKCEVIASIKSDNQPLKEQGTPMEVTVNTKENPIDLDAEKLSQDSFLNVIDLYESDKNSEKIKFKKKFERFEKGLSPKDSNPDNDDFPRSLHLVHTVVQNHEYVLESKNTVDKGGRERTTSCRRRRRGKCVYCGHNTSWHCPACLPSDSSRCKKHWCCGPSASLTPGRKHMHTLCQNAHTKAWQDRYRRNMREESDEEIMK